MGWFSGLRTRFARRQGQGKSAVAAAANRVADQAMGRAVEGLENRIMFFKPYTHVAAAQEVLADVVDDGHVTLAGQEYPVPPAVVVALQHQPASYFAGTVGPDGFPDMIFGQSVIHPEESGLWLRHILSEAWNAQSDAQYDAVEKQKILAFAYGYLTHGAQDLWAHTLVNKFADGVFPPFTEIPTDNEAAANAARHLIVEGYIADATPGYDGNPDRQELPDGDISDDSTPATPFDVPVTWVYNTLVQDTLPDFITGDNGDAGWDVQRGGFIDFFRILRSELTDLAQDYNPANPVRWYLDAWVDDINTGLAAWPEFGLSITNALFNAQAKRDYQNSIGGCFPKGPEMPVGTPLLLDPRGFCENNIGIVDTIWHEAEDYINDHLLSMLGLPDVVGAALDALSVLNDALNLILGPGKNPLDLLKEGLITLGKDMLKSAIKERFGLDVDLLTGIFKKPSSYMDMATMDLGDLGILDMFKPTDHGDLDNLLGIVDPNHHTGWEGTLGDNVTFDRWKFAAYGNAVTLSRMVLLDGPAMDTLLTNMTGGQYTGSLYGAQGNLGNVMLTSLPTSDMGVVTRLDGTTYNLPTGTPNHVMIDADRYWLRSIDADHAWRAPGNNSFDNHGHGDTGGVGNFPLWEIPMLRDNVWRGLFREWEPAFVDGNGTLNLLIGNAAGHMDGAPADDLNAAETLVISHVDGDANGETVKIILNGVPFEFEGVKHIVGDAGGGDDSITLLPGLFATAQISGGEGNDTLSGSDASVTLSGDAGDDVITGSSKDDVLSGGNDDDTVNGGAGDDTLTGGDGDDLLAGDEGSDDLDGGAGLNTLSGGAGNDSITGGDTTDVLLGGADNDTLTGNAGDDYIEGNEGDDQISGGDGNDDLLGGSATEAADGADNITGGAGDDVIVGDNGLITRVLLDGSTATVLSSQGRKLVAAVNQAGHIVGRVTLLSPETGGADVISAGAGNDSVHGGAAADQVNGDGGDDALFGNTGDDAVSGGAGADHLYGGNGLDDLDGGLGADIMAGGEGDDRLVADEAGDRLVDWLGNYNNFIVPGPSYGAAVIVRTPTEGVADFLLGLAESDGSWDPDYEVSVVNLPSPSDSGAGGRA